MSSTAPFDAPTRGRRLGPIIALIVIAFVIGGLLVGYAMRSGWTAGLLDAQATRSSDRGATNFVPAQPLNSSGGTPAVDPTMLVTREAALAGQLSALEARAAAVATDAAAAGAQATRAEALMVAFAARRSIDRGNSLGYLEEQLRSRFVAAQPRAVQVVIQAARTPVTVEDLRQGLDAIAPDLQSASGGDWLADTRREIGNLIVVRREGTPSAAPAERLARARRLLDDGQVAAARSEVSRLPGAAQAGNWMAAARRYMLAHQALDVIETAAILGQAQGPQAPVRTETPVATTTMSAEGASEGSR
ncbi:hypothetical protein [Sphingomonas mollis]|uniref:Inner membrane protein n=1 Tax=Sphingomonas mollis TaxID=2795726 RepID=A0ABS0XRS0_9SPHN|nr:hypothetical protein [Sphingomonas sp. BT553]MBJ6122739.1 hypothetical protein [Sphingomonas sp. BT553]